MLAEFLKTFARERDVVVKESFTLKDYHWRNPVKGEDFNLPLVHVFRVHTIGKDDMHTVVLAYREDTESFYMWCGDKYLQKLGYQESYCISWKNKAAKCKHCQHVAFYLLSNEKKLREIEQKLKEGEEKEEKRTSPIEFSEISISFEEKLPLLLYGVTGSGKTHRVLEFVSTLKDVEFFQINMSSGVEDIDLLAKMIPDPESGKWTIRDGELWKAFLTAVKKPVVILIEELTRASKSARNLLLKAMDSVAGKYILQNFVIGETVEVPTENVWWVATANIGYSDTEELDPALMRRFLITKFVDYDVEKEKEILSEFLSGDEVEKTLKMVKALRRAYTSGQVAYPVDTGTLKTFAKILAKIKDPVRAAEMTFMYRIVDVDTAGYPSEEQIELVRRLVEESFKF